MSRRLRVLVFLLGALLAGGALHALRDEVLRRAEAEVLRRARAEAAARGLALDAKAVRIGWPLRVAFAGLVLEKPGGFRLELREAAAGFRFRGRGVAGRLREVAFSEGVLRVGEHLEVVLEPSSWSVLSLEREPEGSGPDGARGTRRPRGGAAALRRAGAGDTIRLAWSGEAVRAGLGRADLSSLVHVRRRGRAVLEAGTVSGTAEVHRIARDGIAVELNVLAEGARLPSLGEADDEGLGAPSDVELAVAAELHRDDRYVNLRCARIAAAGAVVSVQGRAVTAPDDLFLDVGFEVARVDLGQLLSASGLGPSAGTPDLGAAAARVRVSGRLRDPRSIAVDERVDFTPPAAPVPALERLRSPFVHVVDRPSRPPVRVVVDPASPGFVALGDVPPLFLRALLVAEDANFYGHPGIDLNEIPVAFAVNWVRGEPARGASTITQQLVKNLFLSRERSYGRKVKEAALALLLDRALGKARVLEVYLNVIEWGPDLYGLRPAACRYFGKEPAELTPKEIAFLVTLIPGPVKYQRAFASGSLSPRFEAMVDTLLYRLLSVEALSEEAYEEARAQVLVLPAG